MTELSTSAGAFSVGQEITAPGIPAATTIIAVNPSSLEISQPATATESGALSAQQHFGPIDGIAIAPAGDLVLFETSRFFKFGPSGAFVENFATGFGGSPAGIAIDSKGDIYLVRGSGDIAKVTSAGVQIGGEVFAPGPATGLTVDPSNDDLYVDRGTEIVRYDSAANRLETFSSAHLSAATGLAVGPAGELEVADPSAAHVTVFSLLGPFAGTAPATAITGSAATLHGRLAPTGGGPVTACSFEYVTAEAFEASGFSTAQIAGCSPPPPYSTSTQVSAELSSLNGGTAYHFRLTATDSAATNSSAAATFTTLGPSVNSTSATQVTSDSALLEAELNPHGLPTTYHFEYDTVEYTEGGAPHGTSTPTASAGEGSADLAVSALVQGLAPATAYHYRVVAENELGATEGPDRSFTTQASAVAPFLPDARQWQLVSPPDKNGIALEGIAREGSVIQASPEGTGLAYVATGAIDSGASGNRAAAFTQAARHPHRRRVVDRRPSPPPTKALRESSLARRRSISSSPNASTPPPCSLKAPPRWLPKRANAPPICASPTAATCPSSTPAMCRSAPSSAASKLLPCTPNGSRMAWAS